MLFDPGELTVCGVTEREFLDWLALLEEGIGAWCVDPIRHRTQLDVAVINRAGACAALVNTLRHTPGFRRVVKAIARHPRRNLWEPRGEWFQLVVAYILVRYGLGVRLEEPVQGSPKDIHVGADRLVVECKCFVRGGMERDRLRTYLRFGTTEPPSPEMPEAFTTMALLWPPPLGLPATPILTNHYERFVKNAVAAKCAQLSPGYCNIIAVNTERISQRRDALLQPLIELLGSGAYPAVSGFLLVEQDASRSEDHRLRGQRFFLSLAESPVARVPVQESVRRAVEWWRTEGSTVVMKPEAA